MKNKIKEMLLLQDKLNKMTSWDNWRSWITDKNKIISWKRCMYMEMVEAIDSTPWKHWKAIEWQTDIKNFQVEMIDIWHFLMSEILRLISIDEAIELIEKNVNQKSEIKLPINWNIEENLKLNEILSVFEDFIKLCFTEKEDIQYLQKLVKQFFICLDSCWTNFNSLYKLYIWKNVLNKFRQDKGYKQWTYKKIWSNNKEDNVTMQNYIENNDNFSFDDLYNYLLVEYEK